MRLALAITKHELQDVVRTVIRRAYIEAVVTKDGPITVRARYDLKSSERQRLAVRLRDPRILGFTVAGQTVAPEKGPTDAGWGSAGQDVPDQRRTRDQFGRTVPGRHALRNAAAVKRTSELRTFSTCRFRVLMKG